MIAIAAGGLAGLAGCQSLDVISVTATTATVTGGAPLATETDAVTFVAVVTENNGDNEDLAGGTLTDGSGLTYAALQASGGDGGPYVATLTFEQINQVAPIDFVAPGGHRTFIATFYDDDSDVVSTDITLELACRADDGALASACNGACSDTQIDSVNCGTCGNACGSGESCVAGACGSGVM
jgi:hypothetical protein